MADNRKNLFILSLTMGVVMVGFGMVMPIMPFYIERMGASASELGLLLAISPFIQLFAAPFWGGVSDRYGRKPVLAMGLLGYSIAMLFFGLATRLWMLFLARGAGALLSAATMPTTMAYVSDSTTEQERGGGMGTVGAVMGLGIILGPALGGLLGSQSLATPFFITAGVCVLTLLLVLAFLPESLPAQTVQYPAGLVRSMPQLQTLVKSIFGPLGMLLLMAFLVSFGLTNFQGTFGYYTLKKFGYGTQEVGWILTVAGVVSAAAQGALTGPLTKKWGEAAVIKATLLAGAGTFILLLAANNLATVLLTTGLFTLPNALLRPAVLSLTSKQSSLPQGTVLGLSNSFNSLGRVAGPIWAGFAFDIDMDLPYLSGGAILLAGFLVSLLWLAPEGRSLKPEESL